MDPACGPRVPSTCQEACRQSSTTGLSERSLGFDTGSESAQTLTRLLGDSNSSPNGRVFNRSSPLVQEPPDDGSHLRTPWKFHAVSVIDWPADERIMSHVTRSGSSPSPSSTSALRSRRTVASSQRTSFRRSWSRASASHRRWSSGSSSARPMYNSWARGNPSSDPDASRSASRRRAWCSIAA